jgi:hypothetical protein
VLNTTQPVKFISCYYTVITIVIFVAILLNNFLKIYIVQQERSLKYEISLSRDDEEKSNKFVTMPACKILKSETKRQQLVLHE